jgi:hypothetical protein
MPCSSSKAFTKSVSSPVVASYKELRSQSAPMDRKVIGMGSSETAGGLVGAGTSVAAGALVAAGACVAAGTSVVLGAQLESRIAAIMASAKELLTTVFIFILLLFAFTDDDLSVV